MPMHILLEELAELPQFHVNRLFSNVLHMKTGCAITKYDSDESKYADALSLHWPGQNRDELALVDGKKYLALMRAEAKNLT